MEKSKRLFPKGERFPLRKMILIMKLSIFLLFTALQVSAVNYAQEKINLKADNVSIQEIFKKIEDQTRYRFFYSAADLPVAQKFSINIVNANISQTLSRLLNGTAIKWEVLNNSRVILSLSDGAAAGAVLLKPVTGTVQSDAGAPVAGASVKIKGTNRGTVTDAQGKFTIDVKEGEILEISAIGYTSTEITVGAAASVTATLVTETKQIDEVVVVGYGTQKKVNLTGAVAQVTSKQIENRPITNTTNALQGVMPGVVVIQNNGQPGKDVGTIRVRGIGTLNNSSPLVVVDGAISSMNAVNPNDIETISVLKDAAASAIYGSTAANGVVLITTKKGKKGQSAITYNGYVGKQKAVRLPDFLPSWQAASLYNQGLRNQGQAAAYTDEQIQKFKDGSDPYNYPNTDWLDLFYQGNGIQQNHYLSIAGGGDNTQYMFSLGYFDQNGIVENTNAQRYTSRLNLTSKISQRLSFNANLSYTYAPLQEPTNPYTRDFSQLFRQINRISPIVPYKDANGNYGYISDGSPMAWLENGGFNKQLNTSFQGIAGITYEPLAGLKIKPQLAYRATQNQNKLRIYDIQYYDAAGKPTKYQGPSELTDHWDNALFLSPQLTVDYSKQIDKHNFTALAGALTEYTKFSVDEAYRKNFLNNALNELNGGSSDGQRSTSGTPNTSYPGVPYELAKESFFGRITYNYDSRYLLEANLRYDGSSRFRKEDRWGAFPSFSAGWNISREAFFGNLSNVFSNLKLRASWGKLGNDYTVSDNGTLTYYPAIATISTEQDYTFNGVPAVGVAPVIGANPFITWEKISESNIGLDAGFLNNKLNITADYFIKSTDDILLNLPVSPIYGLTAPTANAGKVRNTGLEVGVDYQARVGEVSLGLNANAAFIKNRVMDLKDAGPIIDGYKITQTGLPINSFYGYLVDGIFQNQAEVDASAKLANTAPGDLKYRDISGPNGTPDGEISSYDRTYLGSYFPKISYGFTLDAGWKGFDVSAFFQGAGGVKGFVQGEVLGQISNSTGKPTSVWLDSWTPENTGAAYPRVLTTQTQNAAIQNPSSFWVRKADYLRFKNLQIGYSFSDQLLSRIGIKKLRIYYSGQNIATFTSFFKWVDPEAPAGERGYTYPQVKVNTIGVNVTF
ncbi:TonB-dependent receptor [Niabella beijingensis]|uniref:TonB-dependent receptor n=1 Tax=Niabella beijingensis TaxID=2872700 RepID=UPI001CBF9EA6|nr:TonB-dependent receptor [Niabella beijingensis]MBZ4187305.1 TonB-dependent receptor [Niabella beijingensis]